MKPYAGTYELIVAGAHAGRTVDGWQAAKQAAVLDAARLNAVIGVWVVHYGERGALRGSVFPDGRWAWERPLHRLPKGLDRS